jgi:MoaA/NifB/PqqE/SkfB family radical SAM enzyme
MDIRQLLRDDPAISRAVVGLRSDPDLPFPILVAKLKLTWRCNLRCVFCSLWGLAGSASATSEAIDTELARITIRSLHNKGLRKLHFSGGECILRKDLGELIALCHELGIQVNLTTNGTLIDKEIARLLVEHRVHTVAVSLDASSAKKHDTFRGMSGAWRLAWEGVERLQARRSIKGRGPRIAINSVVHRKNIDYLGDLFQLLRARGVDSWRLLPIRTSDRRLRPTTEQWMRLAGLAPDWRPLLSRPLLDFRSPAAAHLAAKGKYLGQLALDSMCFAPWFSIFVDANGEVLSCCTGRKQMPVYGNLARSPLEHIVASRTRREVCSAMAEGHGFEVCHVCDEFLEENAAFRCAAKREVPA